MVSSCGGNNCKEEMFTFPSSSSIVEDIMNHCKADASLACAYFFFDGRDSRKQLQTHESLIRSLIMQFSDQCDGLPVALVELYRSCNNGHQEPSLNAIQSTLQTILDGFKQTYIIIDSLDECTQREKLLIWLEGISHWTTGTVRLTVISRPERDIKDCILHLDACLVSISDESENIDIEIYLDKMLQMDTKLNRWDEETQKKIRSVLMAGAQGMYILFLIEYPQIVC